MSKTVTKVVPLSAGSPPDIDSDFHTVHREDLVNHLKEIYGEDKVANIITFGSLKAKGAFKAMCTIHEVPHAEANKVSKLIPDKCNVFAELFDPESEFYEGTEEFRNATAGGMWKEILEGATKIQGRTRNTGLHPCGTILSSTPLHTVVPMRNDPKKGILTSQWEYPQLESIGLIKMDLLGLDTVDLILNAVKNIIAMGKTPPDLISLVNGPMDDPLVYKLFQEGNTIGIFQFGSDMIRSLLKQMKPTFFGDISACTALGRPGPMGMDSHIKYANRKNGLEEIDYIHPDFLGSPMEEILGDTYGLCVYQEQVIKISNQIAGMTLQEGDDLRKAMGKKKIDKMNSMKPKFFSGAMANGYSEDAVTALWNTIVAFAEYGFNQSHSVAYAMNSYQNAYLKVHYPVEFMAALIDQKSDNKDKTLEALQEAARMGLSVGPVSINHSLSRVAPNMSSDIKYDIVFGLSGVKSVSADNADAIVAEREENGLFTSIEDVINRCAARGVNNKAIFINLALAGAFDEFNSNRRAVIESIPSMMMDAKKGAGRVSLFDTFDMEATSVLDNIDIPDYSFTERLRHEADVIGLYLSGHPLDKLDMTFGSNLASMKNGRKNTENVIGAITDVTKKPTKAGSMVYLVRIEDKTGSIVARLSPEIVKQFTKFNAQANLKKMYTDGEKIPSNIVASATTSGVIPMEEVKKNSVYVMNLTVRKSWNEDEDFTGVVNSMRPLQFSHDGSLPVRIRLKVNAENKDRMRKMYLGLPKKAAAKFPGNSQMFITRYAGNPESVLRKKEASYIQAAMNAEQDSWDTSWPPKISAVAMNQAHEGDLDITEVMESLPYVDTEVCVEKSPEMSQFVEKFVGFGSYDFGFYVPVKDEND